MMIQIALRKKIKQVQGERDKLLLENLELKKQLKSRQKRKKK